jgi:hypothetical protein
MSNTGYGIAGAVNVYSCRIKLGNWVEDEFGTEIVQNARTSKGSFVTDQAANHIDPKDMTMDPRTTNLKMMSMAEMKAKNKEGSSYSLLFDHHKALEPEVKYRTSHRNAFKGTGTQEADYSRPNGDLQKERAKRMVREIREKFSMVPEGVTANAFAKAPEANFEPYKLKRGGGGQEPLPIWSRRKLITNNEA